MTHPQPDGFLAVPPTGVGPGVLVLHAWWGLNDTIKAVSTRLAESGYRSEILGTMPRMKRTRDLAEVEAFLAPLRERESA